MSLQNDITTALKEAMKAKDQVALESLRAIKSELLLAKTSGNAEELTEADEIKILQKLVKQRKDAAAIFTEQNRSDLAEPELAQAAVIEQFLPKQLTEAEVEAIIATIISEGNFSGMQAMGQVMGLANAKLVGTADGKTISTVVKKLLTA
ncbi:GatB/YqeY domain-containing protein [Flavobacterium sp. xlx-214]|uniref:GatB/YqeY domain-containing protein n=1 Tax=unclassified Flavobacterium TaxID=196869 RepID=UPI0013D43EF0|nr:MULTISPECIES: GatB/YqeY domain-containing protein [unclassified Flavobacterium]MBA5791936.1 GatB/YqeY domain-containing protein [Flavobacterium sp. xlx-221]QMI84192.1 GatB/YqeY domain-containing protein [Flavobacterium sp. xlx-214]